VLQAWKWLPYYQIDVIIGLTDAFMVSKGHIHHKAGVVALSETVLNVKMDKVIVMLRNHAGNEARKALSYSKAS
jgi:hypothetical protein